MPGRQGVGGSMAATVVLVHGMHHGAWCWQPVAEMLEARGISAIAVDLPGRGAHVDRPGGRAGSLAVIEEAIAAAGGPVVLCGHSAAGDPISFVPQHNPTVRQLVYLAAVLPASDPAMEGVVETLFPKVQPRLHVENGVMRIASFEDARELLYHDCAIEDARWAFDRLIAEDLPARPSASDEENGSWDDVRTTYIVCTQDQACPIDVQRRLAARCHRIVELPTGHSPFLSAPGLVVDILAGLAEEVGG